MQYKKLAISAIAAALALAACGKSGPLGPAPLNVDVAAAKRQSIATYVTLDGQVAPLEQSTLAFQQSGPITKIYVNIGDVVRKGDLLAQIDPSTLQAQFAQAEAQAAQAGASAQGAVVGYPVQTQQNQASKAPRPRSTMRSWSTSKTNNSTNRGTFRRRSFSNLKHPTCRRSKTTTTR
jgi:multidrug efflux pump subunit AcrA (membrane-fusion protein)